MLHTCCRIATYLSNFFGFALGLGGAFGIRLLQLFLCTADRVAVRLNDPFAPRFIAILDIEPLDNLLGVCQAQFSIKPVPLFEGKAVEVRVELRAKTCQVGRLTTWKQQKCRK